MTMKKEKRVISEKEQFIRGVAIPEATKSYQPLSHGQQIDILLEEASALGFSLLGQPAISWSKEGLVYAGTFNLTHPDISDPDMGIRIAEMNSYNSKKSARVISGGNVFVCTNGMMHGDFILSRKHTPGNSITNGVVDDFKSMVKQSLEKSFNTFEELVDDKDRLQSVKFDTKVSAWLVDKLLFEEELLNVSQFQFLKQEMYVSKNFAVGKDGLITLWDFYNNVTEALKTTRPEENVQKHLALHKYTMENLVDYKF